jgi:uncharacterized protein YjaZ
MDDKSKVTEPIVNTIKTEDKTLEEFKGTNQDVANMIAKAKREAIEELLKKDLGVEDVKSAKDGISKFKEMQEAQKTDLQRAIERAEKAESLIATYESKIKDRDDIDSIETILKAKNIDTKYSKTIKKLIGSVEKIDEELVLKTINEELPILVNEEKTKIGVDKPEDKKIVSGTKDYLDKKYANNPYYNK